MNTACSANTQSNTARSPTTDLRANSARAPRLAHLGFAVSVGLIALTLGGCAGMSARDRNTTTGAVIGGAAGAILSGGSAAGAVGGAAVGGVIGNQIDPNKK